MLEVTTTGRSPIRYGDRSSCTSRSAIARDRVEVRFVLGQDRELVAAEAGDQVRRANESGDPLRGRHEECVARSVPERVVDDLEVVEVDEQDRGDPAGPSVRQR